MTPLERRRALAEIQATAARSRKRPRPGEPLPEPRPKKSVERTGPPQGQSRPGRRGRRVVRHF